MYSKLIVRSLAAAAVMMTAGSALAADLYGGGATFPAVPYLGDDYLDTTPDARLSTSAGNLAGTNGNGSNATEAGLGAGSVFATFSANTGHRVSYCQTGSGFGKTRLNTNGATGDCRDFSDSSPQGLSAASATPDFIGTDSPYSTSDYTAFRAGANSAKQGVTQIPTMIGAIALAYDGNEAPLLNLSTEQVCKIYSGQITTWNAVAGSTLLGPIKIVYRSDNSGTSFAFTSYLASKCNGNYGVATGFFSPNQSFATAAANALALYASTAAVSGNNNVVSNAGAAGSLGLGYADFGEVANQGANFARVNGYNPQNFGDIDGNGTDSIALATGDLLRGYVLNGATEAAISTLGFSPAIPTAIQNCMFVVKPSMTISDRYPIAAVTYLNAYARSNAQPAALKGLFQAFLAHPHLPVGFAYMDGNATHASWINVAVNGPATVNCLQ